MVRFLKYFLISLLIIQSVNIFAFSLKDTTSIVKDEENYQIINNMDSLLNLWYVKNAMNLQTVPNQKTNDSLVVDFPDSVYIERLQNLNSLMVFSYNDIVKNFIDLYAKRRKNLVGAMLGLADFYFPIFEKVLDEYNLPLELKYLPIIESALNPRAVSRAGATGLWQFMYTTGKLVNLRITSFVDERRDPVRSSEAAAKYLKQLYNIYGDWMLALAAYNCGPGNVNKAIKRSKGKINYWDIYYYLPKETRGYVPAFIAANYVMNYYHEHHITPQKIEMFPTDTVTINNYLHFEQLSSVLGIDINLLRDLNPQYKKDIIPAKNEVFSLCLPTQYVNKYIELKDSIYKYKDSLYFNAKKMFYKPGDVRSSEFAMLSKVYYTVKPGDDMKQVSKWFNVDQTDVKQWNKLKSTKLKNGQKLLVYVAKDKAADYKKLNEMTLQAKNLFAMNNTTDTKKQIAFKKKETKETSNPVVLKEKEVQDKELQELGKVLGNLDTPDKVDSSIVIAVNADSLQNQRTNTEISSVTAEISNDEFEHNFMVYEVKVGDTIWSIARNFSEITFELMKRNNISESDIIAPGQKIKVKKSK